MNRFGRSTRFAAPAPVAALQPLETDLKSFRPSTALTDGSFETTRSVYVEDTMAEQTRSFS